jgi:microcystin-dependent protein
MSEAYMSQIEMFGFPFAPKYWQLCAGQLLAINQNAALFSLLGTMYGGNGVQTFALPDLRGRVPISLGQGPNLPNYTQGAAAGEETHTLQTSEMPTHTHQFSANTTVGTTATPASNLSLAQSTGKPPTGSNFGLNIYTNAAAATALAPDAVGTAGSNAPHDNHMPYQTVSFCICVSGLFPSRN